MFRVTPPNSPLKVAIAATCLAQPVIFNASLPDFTLSQGERACACRVRQVGGVQNYWGRSPIFFMNVNTGGQSDFRSGPSNVLHK